jgi:hypothetical protein
MGTTWRVAKVASSTRGLVKKGSRPTKSAPGRKQIPELSDAHRRDERTGGQRHRPSHFNIY